MPRNPDRSTSALVFTLQLADSSVGCLPVFGFQGLGVTHAGLTDEFLDTPPISDRRANFRNQFFGHVNREPLAPLAAIQGKAGMALSLGTRWAVLTDAGALPQAQGSGRNRRKLLHLVMEPSDSLLGSFPHVYKSFCLYTTQRARDFWQSVPCKETSAPSIKRWFKAMNWRWVCSLKDLVSCHRPNDGSKMAKRWFKSQPSGRSAPVKSAPFVGPIFPSLRPMESGFAPNAALRVSATGSTCSSRTGMAGIVSSWRKT